MDWTGLEWAIKSDDHADDDWMGLDFPVYVYYYVPESGLSRSLGRYKIIERSKRWNLFTNPIFIDHKMENLLVLSLSHNELGFSRILELCCV